ncbi:MAG: hypothetical protein LC745_11415 [Planctomycetia bacterium]|nr:hypothetical protein [Planctomycetia bacterium]
MGYQLQQLNAAPDPSQVARQPTASADDRRKAYTDALAELRELGEKTKQQYAELADDPEVKDALASLNSRSAKIKYTLGPSKKFLDTLKTEEQSATQGNADAFADEKPGPAPKRKARTKKRR